jgi:hypothetical protein
MTVGLAVALLVVSTAYWFLTRGPSSFRVRFARDANAALGRQAKPAVVTEADLTRCPLPYSVTCGKSTWSGSREC